MLDAKIKNSAHYKKIYSQQMRDVLNKKTTPSQAAQIIFQSLQFSERVLP